MSGNVYVGRNEERWIEIYINIREWVGKWRKLEVRRIVLVIARDIYIEDDREREEVSDEME